MVPGSHATFLNSVRKVLSVRFLPTLSMSEKHLEEAVEMMGDALDELYGEAVEEEA